MLVSVGNTRTRFSPVRDGQLEPSRVEDNTDPEGIARAVAAAMGGREDDAPVLIASVNRPLSDRLSTCLRSGGLRTLRFEPAESGEGTIPIPMSHALDDAKGVGPDRLLGALGAYSRARQACVVIDAGTAITVDFIDGEGTFQGGAIAPGLKMMLDALHERTSALPSIRTPIPAELMPPHDPKLPPFGRATRRAMVLGAVSAARGLAHLLIDRYAEFYEAYPRIIATGGDAPILFEHDELVEHIVPDLTLVGMLEAYRRLGQLDEDSSLSRPDR